MMLFENSLMERTMERNKCSNCKYYIEHEHNDSYGGTFKISMCRRYPKPIDVSSDHWCGEYASNYKREVEIDRSFFRNVEK